MEPLEYRGAPFGVSAERVGDQVTIRLQRDQTVLVEIETTRKGARSIAETIVRAL